jgi:hypothetical protein
MSAASRTAAHKGRCPTPGALRIAANIAYLIDFIANYDYTYRYFGTNPI